MAHVFYPPLPIPLPPHHATVYVAPNGQHFIPSPPPPQPRGPVILWDFDSTPVGSGDRTTAAINSLIGLCRGVAPHATVPMLQFCYTLKRYGYPGKEQVITEVRRHIPPYQLQVTARTSADREDLRAQMRWKIREHLEQRSDRVLILLTGDPNLIQWQRSLWENARQPLMPAIHVCPTAASDATWAMMTRMPPYFWSFTSGLLITLPYYKFQ